MAEEDEKARGLRVDTVRDLAALAGAALLPVGAWQIYRPAGIIVAGALLLAPALVDVFRSRGP
jgi:hypothetical protein